MNTFIRIGTRRITPLFDLAAMEMIEERFGDMDEALRQIGETAESKERRKAVIAMAALLCCNAVEAEGKKPDFTEADVRRATPIKRVGDVRYAVIMAINKGFKSDYDPADNAPVDVVLEEIAKKTNPGESSCAD